MAQQQYGNRSINSLVQELNNLGNRSILIQPARLIAIQKQQLRHLRRFQSKSVAKRQFFKFQQNQKKYFYDYVYSNICHQIFADFMKNWQNRYNCTILLENKQEIIPEILRFIKKWTKQSLVFCFGLDEHNQIFDFLGQKTITHSQLLQNKKYYELEDSAKVDALTKYIQNYSVIKKKGGQQILIDINFKDSQTCAQLHLTFLPQQMFKSQCNPSLSLIKKQLSQVLNYIKMNPQKRYQHISKFITKRLPMTNYLTKILMSDSCNLLINFLSEQNSIFDQAASKLQFFDKLSMTGNILRKPDRHIVQLSTIKPVIDQKSKNLQYNIEENNIKMTNPVQNDSDQIPKQKQELVSPIGKLHLKTENQNQIQNSNKQKALELNQFEFCRSLQRKTHKFSISPLQQKGQKFQSKAIATQKIQNLTGKKTISKFAGLCNQIGLNQIQISNKRDKIFLDNQKQSNYRNLSNFPATEAEQIILLKAEHARQISQYHQTIQLLNKKIIILSKQNNLQELYKIHERQIMLLQLKIKELRQDIIVLTKDEPNEKSVKSIVKKLTEQIKNYQTSSTTKKISQGRSFMLEKQLSQVKQKLASSQKVRATLTLQLQTLTKRLQIRDSEIQKINQEETQKYQLEDLSLTEEQIFEDIKKLVKAVKEHQRNSAEFLLRKLSLILSDLSKYRDIILECNDFLVQLMEILDLKLCKKEPQIVLDCNKYIRGFLMQNLSIF